MNHVGPMTSTCSRFNTLDELFDKANASEVTNVDKIKPHQQQQQPQKQHMDLPSKGSKRDYQPSICEPAGTTSSGRSVQSDANTHGKSGSEGQ